MRTRWKVGIGVAVGGLGLLMLNDSARATAFGLVLPSVGRPFAKFILDSATKYSLDPFKLAGLIEQESYYGELLTPKGPGGTGDNGHGHGLTQIDDRTWGAWLATHDWKDPAVNIDKGAELLADNLRKFGGDYVKALAAYNAGPGRVAQALAQGADPDSVTTQGKYASSVLARAERLAKTKVS